MKLPGRLTTEGRYFAGGWRPSDSCEGPVGSSMTAAAPGSFSSWHGTGVGRWWEWIRPRGSSTSPTKEGSTCGGARSAAGVSPATTLTLVTLWDVLEHLPNPRQEIQ